MRGVGQGASREGSNLAECSCGGGLVMSRIGQILGFRDYGKFKPRHFDIAQEKRQLSEEETRQALRRLAMTQATLTKRRDLIARKMYHNEAISLDDFPG